MSALSFQSVSKTYPPRNAGAMPFKALDRIAFDVEEGEFFGLLGPNGAGKTTLISILAGLVRASDGRVLVHGHDVQADYAAARRLLGVVPQELVFDPFFNVREALKFQSGYLASRPMTPGSTSCWTAWDWPTKPTAICASSQAA